MIIQTSAVYDLKSEADLHLIVTLRACVNYGTPYIDSKEKHYLLALLDVRRSFSRKDIELAIGVCDQTAAHIENIIDKMIINGSIMTESVKRMKHQFDQLQTHLVETLGLMQIMDNGTIRRN
jgi:hypothetical protein